MKKEIVDHYDTSWKEYDEWFDAHQALYLSELHDSSWAFLSRLFPK